MTSSEEELREGKKKKGCYAVIGPSADIILESGK